jgi:hypothetical protein
MVSENKFVAASVFDAIRTSMHQLGGSLAFSDALVDNGVTYGAEWSSAISWVDYNQGDAIAHHVKEGGEAKPFPPLQVVEQGVPLSIANRLRGTWYDEQGDRKNTGRLAVGSALRRAHADLHRGDGRGDRVTWPRRAVANGGGQPGTPASRAASRRSGEASPRQPPSPQGPTNPPFAPRRPERDL